MNQPRRILMTGHNGYIGSIMAPHLTKAGYEVDGLDIGYFSECSLTPDLGAVPGKCKDLRNLVPDDLAGYDAVIHLAALSNDPIGNLNDGWTEDINYRASVTLAQLAKAAGVRRFLFSSSCIMYGSAQAEVVTENSPLDPKTEYARSKVKAEHALRELADEHFSPVYLRNGTVYGVSPRMRFDTVFNDLLGQAATTGEVLVYSDGKPWRPVVHVQDVARSFEAVLNAPIEAIHNQAFNNGAETLNHRVIELAEIAVKTVPGARLRMEPKSGADQRTYKADFTKFARTFPGFQFKWSPVEGAHELFSAFKAVGLTHADFVDRKFTRLKWLQHLIATGRLDSSLRWRS